MTAPHPDPHIRMGEVLANARRTMQTEQADPELARLRRIVAAFDTITSDAEAIGEFSRGQQQDIRLQATLWRRKLGNAEGAR